MSCLTVSSRLPFGCIGNITTMKHSQLIHSLCGSSKIFPMKSMSIHLVSGIESDVARESLSWAIFFINKIPGSAHFLSSDVTLGYQTKSAASPTIALERLWCSCHLPLVGDIRDSNLVDSASSIRLSQRLSHACLSINKSIL